MLNTPLMSIVCVLLASVLGATGQYVFKTAADRAGPGVAGFVLNPWVLLGVVCYCSVMGLFTYAFRKGGTVTVLYPIYATTFIWAAVVAHFFYDQPIRVIHLVGMILLVAGIYCMGVRNAATP